MSVCPDCGNDHEGDDGSWVPKPEIDRDLCSIVTLILGPDATVTEFATLVGSEERASSLLLRACQVIAMQCVTIAEMLGEEDPQAYALELMRKTCLYYASKEAEGGDE